MLPGLSRSVSPPSPFFFFGSIQSTVWGGDPGDDPRGSFSSLEFNTASPHSRQSTKTSLFFRANSLIPPRRLPAR